MPVKLIKTKSGKLLAFPVKKVLPSGVVQLEGRPGSRRQVRSEAMKELSRKFDARIRELEEKQAKRRRE